MLELEKSELTKRTVADSVIMPMETRRTIIDHSAMATGSVIEEIESSEEELPCTQPQHAARAVHCLEFSDFGAGAEQRVSSAKSQGLTNTLDRAAPVAATTAPRAGACVAPARGGRRPSHIYLDGCVGSRLNFVAVLVR